MKELAYRGLEAPADNASFAYPKRENLCDSGKFTGYDIDGGYATEVIANAEFCFPLPEGMHKS